MTRQPSASVRMSDPARPPCPRAAGGMTCEACVEFLMDYLDGLLPAEQRFVFESHLAFCPDCETYMENYRKAVELVQSAGKDPRGGAAAKVPPGLIEAILRARRAGGA